MNFFTSLLNRYFKYYLDGYILFRQSIMSYTEFSKADVKTGYQLSIIDNNSEDDLKARLVQLWNIAYYSNDNDKKSKVDVISNLNDGDICSVIIHNNKVVGMSWFGFEKASQRMDFSHIIKDEKQFVLTHHHFNLPSCRGWGAQRVFLSYGVDYIRENYNKTTLFVFVGVRNFASIRNSLKAFTEYRLVYHLCIDIPFFKFNFYLKKHTNRWKVSKNSKIVK
jgi:hypothetical protein